MPLLNKHKIVALVTLCLFALCKNIQAQSKSSGQFWYRVLDSSYTKIDSVRIDLQTDFKQQPLKIIYNTQTVFNKTITTNHSIDRADLVWIKIINNQNLIKVIKDTLVLVIDLKKCPYKYLGVCYSTKSGLFINEVSNKPIIYN